MNKRELNQLLKYLQKLKNIPVNQVISTKSIELLSHYSLSHNLNLPDALIAATALYHKIPLYTLNRKDFRYIEEIELL